MQDSTLTSHRDSRSTLLLSWFFLSVSLSASLVFTVSIFFSLFDHRMILTACSHCKGHQKVLCLDSVDSVLYFSFIQRSRELGWRIVQTVLHRSDLEKQHGGPLTPYMPQFYHLSMLFNPDIKTSCCVECDLCRTVADANANANAKRNPNVVSIGCQYSSAF